MGWTDGVYRPYTRKDRFRHDVESLPFSAGAISLFDDKNVHLVLRSLACFSGREFFVVGSNNFFPGAAKGLDELITIHHFRNVNEWLTYMRNETDYKIVAVEQSDRSVPINDVKYPEKPCFIFGNEGFGMGDDILINADQVIEIPMNGYHPCLNVGCSASVIFYDYVNKTCQMPKNKVY